MTQSGVNSSACGTPVKPVFAFGTVRAVRGLRPLCAFTPRMFSGQMKEPLA